MPAVVAAPDLMKTEFDEMVAAECILCGGIILNRRGRGGRKSRIPKLMNFYFTFKDIMIRSVDRPFVMPDELDQRSWMI